MTTSTVGEHEHRQAVAALASDFEQRQLPRALEIRTQLTEGEALGDEDSAFLSDVLETLAAATALFGDDPDVGALHRCALGLCDDIMTAASARSQPPVAPRAPG
jgi:hypothetical protein